MTTKTANEMTCIGYIVERPDFIQRGNYEQTEFDAFKERADLHNRGWLSTRAEIYVNRRDRVEIKEGRGIEQCKENPRVFFVTENALRKLEQKYTIAPDW